MKDIMAEVILIEEGRFAYRKVAEVFEYFVK
jgi:hypothetical protein